MQWESRKHRKRLKQHVEPATGAHAASQQSPADLPPWYQRWFPFKPDHIAWWTAVLYDLGSLCFVFASICSFIPGVYNNVDLDIGAVGWASFAGSVFFTIGACFQLGEVMSTPIIAKWQDMTHKQREYMKLRAYKGRPEGEQLSDQQQQQANGSASDGGDSDGASHATAVQANLSSLLYRLDFHVAWIQWLGTIAFNINTFAFSGSFVLTQPELTGLVDFCDVFASCCFTISGYLSVLEVTHTLIPFKSLPLSNSLKSIDWWLTWFNFLGGVGFLLNGILIIYYPDPGQLQPAYPLLIGSVFFQIGSHLQYMEQADTHNTNREQPQADSNGATQQHEPQKVDANGEGRQAAVHLQSQESQLERGEGERGEEGQPVAGRT